MLLYYPKSKVRREILEERERIGPSSNQIGAHIRCGGFLADVNEGTAMITPTLLNTVPKKMRALMNSVGSNHTYFYLSTDSSIAAQKIATALQPIPVKSTNLYQRGHTTHNLYTDAAISRALLELHLVSQSQALLLTSHSAFSKMVYWMSNCSNVVMIRAPYVQTKAERGKRVA